MFEFIATIDLNILLWVQENLRFDLVTALLEPATEVGSIVLALMAVYLMIKGQQCEKIIGITAFVSAGVEVVMVNGFLKNIIARQRPFVVSDEVMPLVNILSEFSFPSGHTALAFAMAFVLYRFLPKKYGVVAILIAMMVGFSRVYLGVHYPSDVFGGIVIAYAASKMAKVVVQRICLSKNLS